MSDGLDPDTDLTFRPKGRTPRPRTSRAGRRHSRAVHRDASVLVELGERWRPGDADVLLAAVRLARRRGARLTLSHAGAGGTGLLRAAAAETPGLRVTEVLHNATGAARVRPPRWTRHALPPAGVGAAADGIAVTGGLGGLGLHVAAHLADRGHRVWLIDRRPVSALPVAAQHQLAALASTTGVAVSAADVAVGLPAPPFPVSQLVHAAGELMLSPVADLDADDLERRAPAKADGLRRAVEALLPHGLRTVVAFGSVESRRPHPLFGGYALANELLRLEGQRLRAAHPALDLTVAEWSLWSGVGMGAFAAGQAADAGFAVVPPCWGAEATRALLDGRAPPEIVLGGPQSSPQSPVRAVAGVGGSSHGLDARSVARLVALCRPLGRATREVRPWPGAVVRAVAHGRRVTTWTSRSDCWRPGREPR